MDLMLQIMAFEIDEFDILFRLSILFLRDMKKMFGCLKLVL